MNISNGARRLLAGQMEDELETMGMTTSISGRKDNICLTRVFRFGGGADEWVKTLQEKCEAPGGGEITIREMWVPDQAGGEETTVVVVASAQGIALKNEIPGRTTHTPGGVIVTEITGLRDAVQVNCERDPLGYIEGTVRCDGKRWHAYLRGCNPGSNMIEDIRMMEDKYFYSLQDTLEAIDRMVEGMENREMDRREMNRRSNEQAQSEIERLFAGGI